jgi:hypothetical protein
LSFVKLGGKADEPPHSAAEISFLGKVWVFLSGNSNQTFMSRKTPYLCTLALTKFLLEFLLINPSIWADKDAFVLPKLEIEIERRLIGKISKQRR